MISLDIEKNQGDDVKGFYGLSTDDKPTTKFNGVAITNGMTFTEIDTTNTYMFNESSKTWVKQTSSGGGTTYTAGDGIDLTNDEISVKYDSSLSLDDNNQLTVTDKLPAVTTTDEGNALIVDSEGKWAKLAIPSQLPDVTAEDNGNVLTVVEGQWAKAQTSAKETVIYKGTTNAGNTFTLSDSKTKGNILADINDGKIVKIYLETNGFYFDLTRVNVKTPSFTSVLCSGDVVYINQIDFTSSSTSSTTGTYTSKQITVN